MNINTNKSVPFAFPPTTWKNIKKGDRYFETIIFGLLTLCEISGNEKHFKDAQKAARLSPESVHTPSGVGSIPGYTVYPKKIWEDINKSRQNKDLDPTYWAKLIKFIGSDYMTRISLIRKIIRNYLGKIDIYTGHLVAVNIESTLISKSPWSKATWTRVIVSYNGSEVTHRTIHGHSDKKVTFRKIDGDGVYYVVHGPGMKNITCKV